MGDLSSEFISIAQDASVLADGVSNLDDGVLTALESAALDVSKVWSKSNLGYQANVYYQGFKLPPPGAMFSREWGFSGTFNGTRGEWVPFDFDDVVTYVKTRAGDPDLAPSQVVSNAAKEQADVLIHRARSAAARVGPPHDAYLTGLLEDLQRIGLFEVDKIAASLMTVVRGPFMVRDAQAMEGGFQPSGHQWVIAEVAHVRWPFIVAKDLARVCERIGQHLEVVDPGLEAKVVQIGSKVFIGHGGASKRSTTRSVHG